jgi:hypothetical protein
MNVLNVLRDSWYFFSHHWPTIVRLCLPLIVLEGLLLQQVNQHVDDELLAVWRILAGLLFYPLYTGALILFLDARSNGQAPRARDLLAASLRLWPSFAVLAGVSMLAILLGASLFVLPGLWLMVKLAFAEYLLVLRGLGPLRALQESFELTSGHFWSILLCVLAVMLPLWLLDAWTQALAGLDADPIASLLLDCINRFLQLFSTVVLFRLFMLRSTQPAVE